MKKIIFALGILFAVHGLSFADHSDFKPDLGVPRPSEYVSQAVYISSTSGIVSAGVLYISTYPAIIHTVNISSPGISAGVPAKIEIWDTNVGTGSGKLIDSIDTTVRGSYIYDVFAASAVYIYNQGGTAARFSMTFREK